MVTTLQATQNAPLFCEKKRWLLFGAPLTATQYKLYDKQLVQHTGLFAVTTQAVPFSQVRNMVLTQTTVQKWFGLSSVHVATNNPSFPECVVKNIRNGAAFAEQLRGLWAKAESPTVFTAD